MNLEVASAEQCVCAGPGLKSSEPTVDFTRGALEIDAAIFFGQNRRQRSLRMVLWDWVNLAALESLQCFNHEVGAHGGQLRGQGLGGGVGGDRKVALHQNVSGV